jgi:transposase
MPNPLSTDIRARFAVLFAQGLTGREIGRRLMISAASASRLSQKLKQGLGLTPADNPRNTGYGRLTPYHKFLVELIHQDPDITLKELQGALADAHDVTASVSGIDQALKRLGYTYKKRASLRMNASAQG